MTTKGRIELNFKEDLIRLSIGYQIEKDSTTMTPGINLDFIDGETVYVPGAAIGMGF
jgi:hypothetical protein